MSELSVFDQLYIEVGKCLSAWNRIEDEVMRLVGYGCSSDDLWQPMEISVGYWAVVSFEARLKWCDTVVRLRTRGVQYAELATKWNNLNSQLSNKAKQRAKVAHGSVVSLGSNPYLVPYFHSKNTSFNTLPHDEFIRTTFEDFVEKLTRKDLQDMKARFIRLRQELNQFLDDWRRLDKTIGRFGPSE